MKLLILCCTIICVTGATMVDCETDMCTFSGTIKERAFMNKTLPWIAIFDTNTTYIGKHAFHQTNVSALIFKSCNVKIIDNEAFDSIESLTIETGYGSTLTIRNTLSTVDAEYNLFCENY